MPFIYVRSTMQFASMVAEFVAAKVRAELRQQGARIMASVEELEQAIANQWDTLSPAVTDIQNKLRNLADQINNGATTAQLQELVQDVNESTSRIAQGLKDAMEAPETPDPTTPTPEPENPLPEPDNPGAPDETGTP